MTAHRVPNIEQNHRAIQSLIRYSVWSLGWGVRPYHTAIEYDNGIEVQWISAGPEGVSIEGFERLVGGVGSPTSGRRASDSPMLNATVGVIIPPDGMTADEYFRVLTTATGNYANHADYDLFPGISNGYNSNSFVAGLLKVTGGKTSVELSVFVGGSKPLLKVYFDQ